jgi:hypothetical protein
LEKIPSAIGETVWRRSSPSIRRARSKLFEIKLVCKIECFRGKGALGLYNFTEWFLALDIVKIK